ncbi:MAG: SHOCT domain-containing protein [Burkholderiales bacterium]|nr:SHOCT domain-containing protein [Burkholderiales bacterium]MDE2626426.1 SHOCT domain-containing protein [Burkholderiales bacterium]
MERRLETLKRLHDKGLITDDEYRQKRKEILQLL